MINPRGSEIGYDLVIKQITTTCSYSPSWQENFTSSKNECQIKINTLAICMSSLR